MYPNGETRRVQNSVAYPSGETRRVQNSVAYPSGETWRVQNSVAYSSGETWRVQNSVAYPNGETWRVQNSVAYPNLASQFHYSGGLHKNEPPEDCFGRFAYQKGKNLLWILWVLVEVGLALLEEGVLSFLSLFGEVV